MSMVVVVKKKIFNLFRLHSFKEKSESNPIHNILLALLLLLFWYGMTSFIYDYILHNPFCDITSPTPPFSSLSIVSSSERLVQFSLLRSALFTSPSHNSLFLPSFLPSLKILMDQPETLE